MSRMRLWITGTIKAIMNNSQKRSAILICISPS
jgi:hypothetical protein